ncbi:DUF58 domain-containing protein [Natronolimnohabitans innermongolicus]|uniref:Uncharacterized protein n=1 Tax=Natronolimnohabitans innermongolicus JCM 12255 TaxID=1227499 RepID=L9WXZ0_9EURY|nr:DUF58 domain-containing protein [Natronolimnohabitans innermongolicus]ELY54287.1 hypothetical protein C493_12809 [Natronolimnohabitans innermongolicus JCM 12255]
MRPTLRGWTALFAVAAAMALAWQYGPRALNAVVAPLVVVLVAAVLATIRVDRPTIRRAPVGEGVVGDRRTVELSIESGSTVSATVRDDVGDGLTALAGDGQPTGTEIQPAARGTLTVDADGNPRLETTLERGDGEPNRFAYAVGLEERGEHSLGPVSITVTDVLGLVKRRFSYGETTTSSVLVYPRVYDLGSGPGDALRTFADAIGGRDRREFDHLREYQRGDSLRDVHWKSAAKRPDADLVVTEYATDDEVGSATIAAECTPGRDDDLATAAASVATFLRSAGVDVGLTLHGDAINPGSSEDRYHELLGALAVLEAGELGDDERRDADVLIQADADGTRVGLEDRSIPFDRLVDSSASDAPLSRDATEHAAPAGNRERGDADDRSGVVS